MSYSNLSVQIKIGSQKNRLHNYYGTSETESKDESIFCTETSDFEVYLQELDV